MAQYRDPVVLDCTAQDADDGREHDAQGTDRKRQPRSLDVHRNVLLNKLKIQNCLLLSWVCSNLDARKKYFSFLRAFAAVAPVTFIAFPQLLRK